MGVLARSGGQGRAEVERADEGLVELGVGCAGAVETGGEEVAGLEEAAGQG